MRRAAGLCCALLLVCTSGAPARPGPPLLYAKVHLSALVAPTHAFPAAPLLVSGTDGYRRGEYLYQDYLYDDHGADTTPGLGASAGWASQPLFAPAAGDAAYPAGDRYRDNAADLVELRIRPQRHAIAYRATLNTAIAADAAVIGIGIDTDRSGGPAVAWPLGAGVSSPGLDAFITAWGTGGSITRFATGTTTPLPAGAVRMDLVTNQMTIRVPRGVLDPGTKTWRYVAGTGLWDGRGWMAPGVFNLAFRFAEPVGSIPGTGAGLPGYTTAPGTGSWFEDGQARDLAAGTTGAEHADVDFGALARHVTRDVHAPGRVQARILSSSLKLAEGIDHTTFPEFGGALQPYLVTLPADYSPTRPAPVLFALHPSNSGYQPFDVFMPHWAAQLGAKRIVVTLLDRGLNGPDGVSGQFTGAAEANFFEAFADLRRHFALDRSRILLSGYSLGAYADYHLAELWPDLFASVFSVVGTSPTNGRDTELLANLRCVPLLAWNQADDALVPYTDVSATAAKLDALGIRHEQWTFPAGNHLAPALRDDWAGAAQQIGDPVVERDPPRVDYGYYP
ncbi:MAG: hypothetical protein QOG68_1412, partial [Solirubrobacteraceae bacterium]|nr:hypothetical protein [Solirubrobacteraceae bacterium]